MKILPLREEFHMRTDGRTVHTEVIVAFLQISERASKVKGVKRL